MTSSPFVDSRLIAAGFGVEHHSTTRLVDNYSQQFQEFGSLRFEIEVKKRDVGATQEKFYLLNEDQCYFLLTLTRNTKQVVDLKKRLVLAFSEFRRGAPKSIRRRLPRKHYAILRSTVIRIAEWTAQPGRAKQALWEHVRHLGGVEEAEFIAADKMPEVLATLNQLEQRSRAFVNDSKQKERVFIDTVLRGVATLPATKTQPLRLEG